MNRLLHNVIWPAVAGNILWSFLQVAAGPDVEKDTFFPKLAALLFVGVYLAIDWINTEKEPNINDSYWKFDLPLAAALATFASGIQSDTWWSNYALALAFVVAILGHCKGAWDLKTSKTSCTARAALAGFNAIGIVLLLIGKYVPAPYSLWLTPVAVLVVVVLFLTRVRRTP